METPEAVEELAVETALDSVQDLATGAEALEAADEAAHVAAIAGAASAHATPPRFALPTQPSPARPKEPFYSAHHFARHDMAIVPHPPQAP